MLATALTSLVVIIVLHYLYLFLRDALTVPKIRDMVHKPQRRYSSILHSVEAPGALMPSAAPKADVPDKAAMQAELGAFLRDLKRDGGEGGAPQTARQPSIERG